MCTAKQGPDSLLFGGQGRALRKCQSSPQERDGWVCGAGKGGEVGKLSTVRRNGIRPNGFR